MKFYMPTKVITKKNCVLDNQSVFAAYGERALIVTGRHSSRVNGSLEDAETALRNCHISYWIFDEIEENPSVETVMRARAFGLEKDVQFVIGIGGGSPLDAAKAIALMIANSDADAEFLYHPDSTRQTGAAGGAVSHLPVIAIPTTAGTGSEVTPWAVLTIHAKHTKKSIAHKIFPDIALVDTNYLKSMPRKSLVSTAVDTLAHLIESDLVSSATDYSRLFSLQGLRSWGAFRENLRTGSMTDTDYDHMMFACTMGGIAIAHTSTGLPHALSYSLTYEAGLAHGLACGYTLGGFLRFCKNEQQQANVLTALGFDSADAFCHYLESLIGAYTAEAGISDTLWENNVAALLDNAAKMATCPYELSKEELLQFPLTSIHGRSV